MFPSECLNSTLVYHLFFNIYIYIYIYIQFILYSLKKKKKDGTPIVTMGLPMMLRAQRKKCDKIGCYCVPIYRPYATPYVTKRETDSERKSGYYAAILSGKEDRGIGA